MLIRRSLMILLWMYCGISTAQDSSDIRKQLKDIMPGIIINDIIALHDNGLYEAIINGEIIYFTADLNYVIQGDVFSLTTRKNITEDKRDDLRKQALASLDEDDMIVYASTNEEVEYTITIFTDIDCSYCRKLHKQMTEYNDLGIRIRYLAFPRAGINSKAFNKSETVWCSKNRAQAMTNAQTGINLKVNNCRSPVLKQYELGRKIGIQGTPSLLLANGRILPGYIPPTRLKQILENEN